MCVHWLLEDLATAALQQLNVTQESHLLVPGHFARHRDAKIKEPVSALGELTSFQGRQMHPQGQVLGV